MDNGGSGYVQGLNQGQSYQDLWAYKPVPTVLTAPLTQASDVKTTLVTSTRATLFWTNGSGSNRIVFISAASNGTPVPVNATTYTASSTYKSGAQIGTSGWYSMYNGSASSVTVTGLTAGTNYRVTVMEYNGVQGSEQYLNTFNNNTLNFTTLTSDPVSAPAISYSTTSATLAIGKAITPFKVTNRGGAVPATAYGQVSTFAGNGAYGYTDGIGSQAEFTALTAMTTGKDGYIYLSDAGNNVIRRISPDGTVSTYAGNGPYNNKDGTLTTATFDNPRGLAFDNQGNLFIAEYYNFDVRKISPDGKVITYCNITNNTDENPIGLTVGKSGTVYVANNGANKIQIVTSSGSTGLGSLPAVANTFAGNGTAGARNDKGSLATFNGPTDITIDAAGNLYVADSGNNLIRKITADGTVSIFAGNGKAGNADGPALSASFNQPWGLCFDAFGNLYVSDSENNLIRKITPDGVVSTFAGTGSKGFANGTLKTASFNFPEGMTFDKDGNLYICDNQNRMIRKIILTGYTISPALPAGLTLDGTTGTIGGTPGAASPETEYTITAYNSAGSSSTKVKITTGTIISPTVQASTVAFSNTTSTKQL